MSLAFRSVDPACRARFPLGTHVAWHILNGAVLYVFLRAAIAFRARERGRRP